MALKFDQLTQPCQDSIRALSDVRDNYVHAEQEQQCSGSGHYHHHHHPFIILGAFALAGYAFYRRHQKMKDIRQILNVIDANPSLKQQVESVAGVAIPPHNELLKSSCESVSCVVTSLSKFVAYLIAFVFVIITSLMLTHKILFSSHHSHSQSQPSQTHGDYDDDTDNHDSIRVGAVFVFLGIATAETIALAYAVKFTQSCLGYGGGSHAGQQQESANELYAPLSQSSSHGPTGAGNSTHEMASFTVTTGTAVTQNPTIIRPVSSVTML